MVVKKKRKRTGTSTTGRRKASAWERYKGKVTQDALRQKQKEFREGGEVRKGYLVDDVDMFIPRDGANIVRIVPPLEVADLAYYGMDVYFHRNVGLNNDYYLCLRRMYNEPCYICEQQTAKLWEEDRELAKSYYPDHRVLMWVLDLASDNPDQLLLWSCPRTLAEEILGQSHKRDSDVYLDVSDPFEGTKVFFDRIGQGIATKYKNVQLGEEPFPLDEDLADELRPFAEVLVKPTYEEVKSAMEGGGFFEEEAGESMEEEEETVDIDAMDRPELESLYYELGGGESEKKLSRLSDDNLRQMILDLETAGEEEDEMEQEEEEVPECFGVEYDKYQDCEGCEYAEDCEEEQLARDGKKKAKKKRRPVSLRDEQEQQEQEDDDGDDSAASSVRARLEKAIESRKKKRA